jgi:hypothetical protein
MRGNAYNVCKALLMSQPQINGMEALSLGSNMLEKLLYIGESSWMGGETGDI